MSKGAPGVRYAEIFRESKETRVEVVLDLDGGTRRDIATGVPFFDHMLQQMAFHGQIDMGIGVEGDLQVDDHHTVEDVGMVIGQALTQALGDEAIERYGSNLTPMDETLVMVAIDVSGRGVLAFDVPWQREKLGDLSTECVREFFRALAMHGGITIHIRKIAGENDHHVCEAIFKGIGARFSKPPGGASGAGRRQPKGGAIDHDSRLRHGQLALGRKGAAEPGRGVRNSNRRWGRR